MPKRIILVGFKKPKSLEKDIIYVTLEKETKKSTRARAISAKDFNYPCRAISGNILRETTKEITNAEGIRGHLRNYNIFLEEIVKKNEGILDYSQAIKEGSEAYRIMKETVR